VAHLGISVSHLDSNLVLALLVGHSILLELRIILTLRLSVETAASLLRGHRRLIQRRADVCLVVADWRWRSVVLSDWHDIINNYPRVVATSKDLVNVLGP
jgi:hypothetical protein